MQLRLASIRDRIGDIAGALTARSAAIAAAAEAGDGALSEACARAAGDN